MVDKLCAILSQFEFSNTVKSWEAQDVPFRTRLYVPEKHPVPMLCFTNVKMKAMFLRFV